MKELEEYFKLKLEAINITHKVVNKKPYTFRHAAWNIEGSIGKVHYRKRAIFLIRESNTFDYKEKIY